MEDDDDDNEDGNYEGFVTAEEQGGNGEKTDDHAKDIEEVPTEPVCQGKPMDNWNFKTLISQIWFIGIG